MIIPFFSQQKFKFNNKKKINFIDLARQRKSKNKYGKSLKNSIDNNIKQVLKHGQYILGPEVGKLENKLKIFTNSKYCIGVSSGTDALLIALMALNINEGDEVITTSFSFFATAEVIALLKAKPIFVDIDSKSYNIDPKKIESKITEKTKAIIAVSLYGQPADFKEINRISNKYSIPIIEDAAQSFGALQEERKSCNLSTIGVTSFFPSKPLGCYGDGGACFTNNEEIANKIRRISLHGQEKRYHHSLIGINGRLDTLQAAILLAKFDFYPSEIKKREENARFYSLKLNEIGIKSTPFIYQNNTSVYAQYTIQIKNRALFQKKLKDLGIPTAVHYPKILPMQPVFQSNKDLNDIINENPISYVASQRVVSLPFDPWLKKSDIKFIVDNIKEIINQDDFI